MHYCQKPDYLTVGCSRELTFKAHFLVSLPVFTGKEEPSDQLSAVVLRKPAENVLHPKGHAATTGSSIFTLKSLRMEGLYVLCLVASKIWRFSSLSNKQPLHPLQLNPNATSSVSMRRPFGKAEHKVLSKPEGEGEGRYAAGCLKTLGTSLVTR